MDDGDDVFNKLPDHLLIYILSRLTLKEAMVTSVLSRRWEKLWTFYHGNLDFEVVKGVERSGCSDYSRLVDKVLDSLELVQGGGVLDSCTARFNLCPNNVSSVDRWVRFALEKRMVKRLDFSVNSNYDRSRCSHSLTYEFPPLRCFNFQRRNIHALTSIHFQSVNVSSEIIEHFLSNCPLLQSLELTDSYYKTTLSHLRISGEKLALRHLVIKDCYDLTTIELSAPNLVSLNYQSNGTKNVIFDVRNVSKLEEFSFGQLSTPHLTTLALHLFTCFSYIQKLELDIVSEEPKDLIKLIEMTSVKHLALKFIGANCGSILAWTPLLKAFPGLQKFTVDMRYRLDKGFNGMTRDDDKFPNKCLKVFEFLGFGWSDDDIELVMHFLKNMVTLEKILLRCDGGAIAKFLYKHHVDEAVSIAAKLKQIIPKESPSTQSGLNIGEYTFADAGNFEHSAKYLNQTLNTFGFPASLDVFANDPVSIARTCNCVYSLLQQRQRDIDDRMDTRDLLNPPNGLSKQSLAVNERADSNPCHSPLVGRTDIFDLPFHVARDQIEESLRNKMVSIKERMGLLHDAQKDAQALPLKQLKGN